MRKGLIMINVGALQKILRAQQELEPVMPQGGCRMIRQIKYSLLHDTITPNQSDTRKMKKC